MRYSISAKSQASVPPAPGLIDTMALAASCLPLIIAWQLERLELLLGLRRAPAPISASNAGVLVRQLGHRGDVVGGAGQFLVRLEEGVEHLHLLDDAAGRVLVVPEVRARPAWPRARRGPSVLPGMSKRVPELGQPGAQVVGAAAEVGVHRRVLGRSGRRGAAHGLDSSIAKRVRAPKASVRPRPAVRSLGTRDRNGRSRSWASSTGKVAVDHRRRVRRRQGGRRRCSSQRRGEGGDRRPRRGQARRRGRRIRGRRPARAVPDRRDRAPTSARP